MSGRAAPPLDAVFARAEALVSGHFRALATDPARGAVEVGGDRYVLVRAASLAGELFGLAREHFGSDREDEADAFARDLLFDLAHAVGRADAQQICARLGIVEPAERIAAGVAHLAHTGWARVELLPESRVVPGDDLHVLFDHRSSFEADAWLGAGGRRGAPACVMNAGYASGWGTWASGSPVVAAEVLCRARGDEVCRFLMAPPARLPAHVEVQRRRVPGRLPPRPPIPAPFARARVEDELRRGRAHLEEQLGQRTAELALAHRELARETAQRERAEGRLLQTYKLEAIGRLAGGIAHDFNNLMAVIAVNGDLLRRRLPEGDPAHGFLEDIAAATERATALTQQLLAFSRAQPSRVDALDLNAIVVDLGRMLGRVLGEDVAQVTRLAPDLGAIEADRGQIEQVVMNLVVNARDAMPGGGTLTIETRDVEVGPAEADRLGGVEPGPYVALAVRDTGTGMDEATLAQVFDPFFTTKGLGKGTGLGLATVYGIVKQAGGGIAVESAPGAGTQFTVFLARSEARPAPPPKVEVRAAPLDGTETILVVEDQERLREALGVVLGGFGYTVLAARDADEALRVAAGAARIDLLLTDVVLPRASGPVLAERIRASMPEIKVLFMSGYTAEAVDLAGAALLAKPFRPDDLGVAVRAALARPR